MSPKRSPEKPTESKPLEDAGLPSLKPDDERRPKEDGGHDRRTYSLDEVTRGYLAGISEKQRSETVEDAVFMTYLLTKDEMKAFEGIRPEREGRRRRVAKVKRL